MGFASDYIDVATRIAEFRQQHPEGSLQQICVDFREVGGKTWIIYTAAAYRTPDDIRPGHGTAWEPVPGKTNFTRDSELQNAETSAWGRAIVASLAADTKAGVASAEEVRSRAGDGTANTEQENAPAAKPNASFVAASFVKSAQQAIEWSGDKGSLDAAAAFIKEGVAMGKCSEPEREQLQAQYATKMQEVLGA